jgi:hypothetical protein
MYRRFIAICLLGTIASTGCTTFGPAFKPHLDVPTGKSVIYIYRPQAHALSALTAEFTVDGVPTARLENNGYVSFRADPGAHKVQHRWKAGILGDSGLEAKTIETHVTTRVDRPSFVKLSAVATSRYDFGTVRTQLQWQLREVSDTLGMEEILECRQGRLISSQ